MKEEAIADLRALVLRKVAEGFDSPADIEADVCEVAEDEYPDLEAGPLIKAWVDEAIQASAAAEREWPPMTDCDRLDQAFALLEMRGIVARQNFACCQNCGHAEIGDEIRATQKARPVIGYTFFHMQDTERAAEGGGLYLAYGPVGDTLEVEVGRHIEAALREAGLLPAWNGETTQRIHVPMIWQKRRSSAPGPVAPSSPSTDAHKPWWQLWRH